MRPVAPGWDAPLVKGARKTGPGADPFGPELIDQRHEGFREVDRDLGRADVVRPCPHGGVFLEAAWSHEGR
jgi:hypothetical protein